MSTIERDVLDPSTLAQELAEKEKELEELRSRLAAWEEMYEAAPKRDDLFTTVSGKEVKPLYTPLDRAGTRSYRRRFTVGVGPGPRPFRATHAAF